MDKATPPLWRLSDKNAIGRFPWVVVAGLGMLCPARWCDSAVMGRDAHGATLATAAL